MHAIGRWYTICDSGCGLQKISLLPRGTREVGALVLVSKSRSFTHSRSEVTTIVEEAHDTLLPFEQTLLNFGASTHTMHFSRVFRRKPEPAGSDSCLIHLCKDHFDLLDGMHIITIAFRAEGRHEQTRASLNNGIGSRVITKGEQNAVQALSALVGKSKVRAIPEETHQRCDGTESIVMNNSYWNIL